MWQRLTSGKLDVVEASFGKLDVAEVPNWTLRVVDFFGESSR